MATLHGRIFDAVSGAAVEAKVHVVTSGGTFRHPADGLLKRGPGVPFFFCEGTFTVDVPRGSTDILVERGTEYVTLRKVISAPKAGHVDVELPLQRWTDLPTAGWHPGNTHIHYDEKETRPYDRLRMDSRVEGYSVTVVSILHRWELPYASNQFPLGVMTDYCTAHHVVDIGEENRHNVTAGGFGYGHIMFLRIRNLVEPVSRGTLVNAFNPDYPPLCYACDETREQGGIVLWCHNGQGMEAPVAAALGKLDGFNLFDPYWMDPEYDIWYRMLNCGLSLPASTGTDWFICSNNRVYIQTGDFSYDNWIEGMKRGRTFITNGPALFIDAEGHAPGDRMSVPAGRPVPVAVRWQSHYPVNRVEVIQDGAVAAERIFPDGSREGDLEVSLKVEHDGWTAARCSGEARDSFGHAVYAHTSPVYVQTGRVSPASAQDAAFFVGSIDQSLDWIARKGRYANDRQRQEVRDLFLRGREVYEGLMKGKVVRET